ncbi:carboxyl transferase domain-containing protein [Mariniluteicoccus flavus]
MSERLGARALLDLALDDGSWESWDSPIDLTGFDETYRATLTRAAERSGTDEAVITGRGLIDGLPVAVIAGEFRFLGGSIGHRTAQRIEAGVRRATAEGLPLFAATSSGGTRMQEGTPAFVEMVSISRAIVDHKAARLPYLVYLRHPTTGGVFASWGSLGHVSVAEPGSLIGFLGPKVYEALHGREFPQGVQLAENLVDHGIIDAVVPIDQVASVAARVVRLLHPAARTSTRRSRLDGVLVEDAAATTDVDVWDSVLRTRSPKRPGVRELLKHAADDVIPLSGTGHGEHDSGLMLALARLDGIACVVVGQDRRYQAEKSMGPAALRSARRGMRLAAELDLPLVSVIDTPGADLSANAEEGALAGEIARCIADMTQLTVPSVALVLGQGCGGGALAILPARRVIAAEHAWLSPLPPEGASVILHDTPDRAPEMTRRQGVSSRALLASGIVHRVIAEGATDDDPVSFCQAMAAACAQELRGQLG